MTAFKLALEIEQGATFQKIITWKAGTPAVPVAIAGCQARMQIRERIDSTETLLSLTTENGGIVLDTITGTITMQASATQTRNITKHNGVYDLEIQFPDATVRRLLSGLVNISHTVTRG